MLNREELSKISETFTLEEVTKIAIHAKDHAQNQILKGSTQLENNLLSALHRNHLKAAVRINHFTINMIDSPPLDLNQNAIAMSHSNNKLIIYWSENNKVMGKAFDEKDKDINIILSMWAKKNENKHDEKLHRELINAILSKIERSHYLSCLSIRDEFYNRTFFNDDLEKDERVILYENIITVTSKFSLGNCFELAIQALDDVLINGPADINAELFKIEGGDHVVLVLNRDPSSEPKDPYSWGANAVFEDGWADKVFQAYLFQHYLKCYYEFEGKNCVEDYNSTEHQLMLMPYWNSNFLRHNRSINNLQTNFIEIATDLMKKVTNYNNDLKREKSILLKIYGDKDKKVLIISDKNRQIEEFIISLLESIVTVTDQIENIEKKDYQKQYRPIKSLLTSLLQKYYNESVECMQFNKKNLSILFFNDKTKEGKTEVQIHLEKITEKVNETLSSHPKIT